MLFMIRHFLMNYHYRMTLRYNKKFKHHCQKHTILFNKNQGIAQEKNKYSVDMTDEECLKCKHHAGGGCDTWCDHGEAFESLN